MNASADATAVGLIGLPALAAPLRAAGLNPVGEGRSFREAVTAIRDAQPLLGMFGVIVGNYVQTPVAGLTYWMNTSTNEGLAVVGLLMDGDGEPTLEAARELTTPVLLSEVLAAIGVDTSGLAAAGLADALVGRDGSITGFVAAEDDGSDTDGSDADDWDADGSGVGESAEDLETTSVAAPVQPEPIHIPAPVIDRVRVDLAPRPTERRSVPTTPSPTQSAPVQSAPVQHPQVQTAPVQHPQVQASRPPAPVQPAPTQPVQVQTAPVQAAPVQVAPVQPAPVAQPTFTPAPAPVQPAPAPVAPARPVRTIEDTPAISGGRLRSATPVVIVWSGKGGIGKTSISSALAQRAADAGKKVILIDANFGQADQRVLIGLPSDIPTIYHAVVKGGDIRAALLRPNQINQMRSSTGNEEITYALLAAPAEKHADPTIVTPTAYLSMIEQAQKLADLVVVDTQIVEADHSEPMVNAFLLPLLRAGAWGVAATDETMTGLVNLLSMLTRFSAKGVGRDRMLSMLNKVPANAQFNEVATQQKLSDYSTYLGSAGADQRIHRAQNERRPTANIDTIAPFLDAILGRVIGLAPRASATADEPARARPPRWWQRFGRGKGQR